MDTSPVPCVSHCPSACTPTSSHFFFSFLSHAICSLVSMPLFMAASGHPHASEPWLKLPLLVSLSLM